MNDIYKYITHEYNMTAHRINNTPKKARKTLVMDFYPKDMELCVSGAKLTGLTFSAYMRMCGITKARELIKMEQAA